MAELLPGLSGTLANHRAPPALRPVLRYLPRPLLTNLATETQHLTTYPVGKTLLSGIVGGNKEGIDNIQHNDVGIILWLRVPR